VLYIFVTVLTVLYIFGTVPTKNRYKYMQHCQNS
jgi:hypothetical protein